MVRRGSALLACVYAAFIVVQAQSATIVGYNVVVAEGYFMCAGEDCYAASTDGMIIEVKQCAVSASEAGNASVLLGIDRVVLGKAWSIRVDAADVTAAESQSLVPLTTASRIAFSQR